MNIDLHLYLIPILVHVEASYHKNLVWSSLFIFLGGGVERGFLIVERSKDNCSQAQISTLYMSYIIPNCDG